MSPADAAPAFSWSYTRDRTLAACERRYFYQYYAAHGGWRPGAPAEARLAYQLKQLATLDMVLGTELHARAREMALAIRAHREPPGPAVLRDRTRRALNAAYRDSRDAATRPAGTGRPRRLREMYYGGGLEPEKVARIREKMERCLRTLVDSSVWDDLRRCAPAEIRLIDAPATFRFGGVDVYAAPDLLYRSRSAWTLVDWKTGSSTDATRQLALYALFTQQVLRLVDDASQLIGRIVMLADGRDEIVALAREDLDAAAAWARESIARMRQFLVDVDANVPAPRETFAMTSRWSTCQCCNFLRCCAAELGLDRCWSDERTPEPDNDERAPGTYGRESDSGTGTGAPR